MILWFTVTNVFCFVIVVRYNGGWSNDVPDLSWRAMGKWRVWNDVVLRMCEMIDFEVWNDIFRFLPVQW